MGIRNSQDPFGSGDGMVDKLVGNAYSVVHSVALSLKYIRHVSYYMPLLHRLYLKDQDYVPVDEFSVLENQHSSRTIDTSLVSDDSSEAGEGTGSLRAVDTIPDLRKVDSTGLANKTNILVLSQNILGDYRGVFYYWDAASLVSDNGLAIIKPTDKATGSPGRWIAALISERNLNLDMQLIDFDNRIAALDRVIGDKNLIYDEAYNAQQSAVSAEAAALDARLSEAQFFPPDFTNASKFWTGDNGQISRPEVAANNPLPGTFAVVPGHGQVYRTPANPESCSSLGPVGYIPGIPGTLVKMRAGLRALTDVSNDAIGANSGIGILPLNDNFGLNRFIEGSGVGTLKVSQGWVYIEWEFTIPLKSDVNYGSYYRPTLFLNVVGQANPLTPSLVTQGNSQFEVEYFSIVVTQAIDNAVKRKEEYVRLAPGVGRYVTPVGATRLRGKLKAAGGGGEASGAEPRGYGEDGGNTTFGVLTCTGGKKGTVRTGGIAAPGWRSLNGQPGGLGAPQGYTYAAGGKGGGEYGGTAAGSQPGDPGLYGGGGAGGGADSINNGSGNGAGEGGETDFIIDSPESGYDYNIGFGGAPGVAGNGGRDGGKGGNGFIEIVAEFD